MVNHYAVLKLPEQGLCLALPLHKIAIGCSSQSQLILDAEIAQDSQALLHLTPEQKWELVVEGNGAVWLNGSLLPRGKTEQLQTEDTLFIGKLRLQFFQELPSDKIPEATSSVSSGLLKDAGDKTAEKPEMIKIDPASKYIQVTSPDNTATQEEAATESLRIVRESTSRYVHTWRRIALHILIVTMLVATSYVLLTGKLHSMRDSLRHTAPPIPTSHVGDYPHRDTKNAIEKGMADWVLLPDMPLLYWRDGDTELEQRQQQMLQKFRESKFAEAESIYQNQIFPSLHMNSQKFINALKYNVWALRWYRMFHEWEKSKDKELVEQLGKELDIVKLQVNLYLTASPTRASFYHLLRDFEEKLSRLTKAK